MRLVSLTFCVSCALLSACGGRTSHSDLSAVDDDAGGAAGKQGGGSNAGSTSGGLASGGLAGSGLAGGGLASGGAAGDAGGSAPELPRFQGLGICAGSTGSMPAAISRDGTTVVGQCLERQQSFRWDEASGMTSLPPATSESWAIATDARGDTIVGSTLRYECEQCQGHQRAARWQDEMLQDLGVPDSQRDAVATGLSGDANLVVGYTYFDGALDASVFHWTRQGGFELLGPGAAMGVSRNGRITVGYRYEQSSQRAMRWSADGTALELTSLPGHLASTAYAADADGSVIVGSSASANQTWAARWTSDGGATGFGPLPGDVYTALYATNEDGSVAVGVSHPRRPPTREDGHALLWDDVSGARTLESELSGAGIDIGNWKLVHASAVSANGRVIVGIGRNPQGQTEAWIARLP